MKDKSLDAFNEWFMNESGAPGSHIESAWDAWQAAVNRFELIFATGEEYAAQSSPPRPRNLGYGTHRKSVKHWRGMRP